jgi:hypothetical protein
MGALTKACVLEFRLSCSDSGGAASISSIAICPTIRTGQYSIHTPKSSEEKPQGQQGAAYFPRPGLHAAWY